MKVFFMAVLVVLLAAPCVAQDDDVVRVKAAFIH